MYVGKKVLSLHAKIIKARIMERTVGLTPMQLHLVSMLNFNRSEEAAERLKVALEQFYLAEFERMKSEMRYSGSLTEEIVEESARKHFRTAY